MKKTVTQAYGLAKQRYAELGIDTDAAMRKLGHIAISLHCWQGDDVGGYENPDAGLDGGLAVTGNFPGKARTPEQLRQDLDCALGLIPGHHRLNLHAIYAETGRKHVERDELQPRHFANWIDWAKGRKMGLDFNPTCFSHPKASSGFTLSNANKSVRRFWVDHCIACRHIGAAMGKALGTPTVTNIWIPDGYKDTPADRLAPRQRLKDSLDEIFSVKVNKAHNLDAIEGKLFGIGSESYVVGSNEFYLGYAIANKTLLTLDAGHYHPTETISDKLSAVLLYVPEVLLHVSRGVRWDSDHVVTLTDDLRAIAEEIVRSGSMERIHIGLDYFDASINRVAAWVIGTRNMLKALLIALLEPQSTLRKAENAGDLTTRLALLEELKSLPWQAVWDCYCESKGVPSGESWLAQVKKYENEVLSAR